MSILLFTVLIKKLEKKLKQVKGQSNTELVIIKQSENFLIDASWFTGESCKQQSMKTSAFSFSLEI